MKVLVRIQGRGDFTYEAPEGTAVGDEGRVSLWSPWEGPYDRNYIGTVVSLETDYDRPCKPFRPLPRTPEIR